MTILFGVLVLALLVLGLQNRKKERKKWVKEERFEESGDWLDKRSGERGTYGSLDDEMEANRKYIAQQSKISELALAVQSVLFEQSADFQTLHETQIKQHLLFCKSEFLALFQNYDRFIAGEHPAISKVNLPEHALRPVLKKMILDFSFERFPKLLDLEIDRIQQIDQMADQVASKILSEPGKIKG